MRQYSAQDDNQVQEAFSLSPATPKEPNCMSSPTRLMQPTQNHHRLVQPSAPTIRCVPGERGSRYLLYRHGPSSTLGRFHLLGAPLIFTRVNKFARHENYRRPSLLEKGAVVPPTGFHLCFILTTAGSTACRSAATMGKRGLAAEQGGSLLDSKEPGPGVVHPIAKGLAPASSFSHCSGAGTQRNQQ